MTHPHPACTQFSFDSSKVFYLTGDVNYCWILLLTGKAVLTSRTLKWHNQRWPQFIRIHKSYLVNPEHIHSCIIVSSIVAHLIMYNGARLPIGRRRIKAVVDRLGIDWPDNCFAGTHVIKSEWDSFAPTYIRVA